VLRERVPALRLAGLRVELAAPVDRFAAGLGVDLAAPADRFAAGLRAAEARLTPGDFARADGDFFAVARLAVERFAVEPLAVDLRAPPLRAEPEPARAAEPLPELSPIAHLPVMTRCAASATASAMIEPSLVALDMTLLAATEAVSAASSPASRIARRAFGLALIAAAAAASPAASISLLIAAFAILSTVLLVEVEEDRVEDFEELLRAAFAIVTLPLAP